jgi:hypothetical protein
MCADNTNEASLVNPMGMFDDVYCEADLPSGHPESEGAFETKSLFRCLDRLTITREGRLVLHAFHYPSAQEAEAGLPAMVPVPEGDIELEFHGDIRLTSTIEDRLIEYVARFSHGTPWSELSEIQRALLTR